KSSTKAGYLGAIMKIKIDPENAPKIEAALLSVNGKSTAHTFTTFTEIATLVNRAEGRFNMIHLSKTLRDGAVIVAYSGRKLPSSYKYTSKVTRVELRRSSRGWFLISASSQEVYPSDTGRDLLVLMPPEKFSRAVDRYFTYLGIACEQPNSAESV
ncbi:MAG: hypothetical protein ACP5QA_10385, partial [Phycisphaerae bacterium]